MFKKSAMAVLLLGALICISAPAHSEDNTANPADVTAEAEAIKDITPLDEDALLAEEGIGEGVVTGEVTVLDATAGSITVKGADGAEKAFNVVDGETILWKGIEDIKLADIKKGDSAEVGFYTDDAGKLIASWVDVIIPEQPIAPASISQPPAPAEAATE